MAKQHWTKYLREIGDPIRRKANIIEDITDAIGRKEMEVRHLREQQQELENEITDLVRIDWPSGEIIKARETAAGIS